MGLDADLKFKVWVPKEYKDPVSKDIANTLNRDHEQIASIYMSKLEVVSLEESFELVRDAGISLLPGMRLYLLNGKTIRLTAFFVRCEALYAISTTHLDDFTGEELFYDAGMGYKIALGKIVSHVCEGDPFREACLIEIYNEQASYVSEYVVEGSLKSIRGIYRGDAGGIPEIWQHGLMNCEPEKFYKLKFKAVLDINGGGHTLKDAVVWTSSGNNGGPGDSGAGIFGKSYDDNLDLLAMYIGHGKLGNQRILISHTMQSVLDYFREHSGHQLQPYNPLVDPVTDVNKGETQTTDQLVMHPNEGSGSGNVHSIPMEEPTNPVNGNGYPSTIPVLQNHDVNFILTSVDPPKQSPGTKMIGAASSGHLVNRDSRGSVKKKPPQKGNSTERVVVVKKLKMKKKKKRSWCHIM